MSNSQSSDVSLKVCVTDVNSLIEVLEAAADVAADLRRLLNQPSDATDPMRKRQLEVLADIVTRVVEFNTKGYTNSKLSTATKEWCADGQIQLGATKYENWFRQMFPLAGTTSNYQQCRKYRTGSDVTFHVEVLLYITVLSSMK